MKSLHIKPLIFCTIILLLHKSRAQNNPCPSVFQYSRDSNENFGLFTLNGAQMGQSVVVDVEFSVRGRLTSSYYGEIMLVSGKEEAVQKILRNQPVIYKIRFPVQNQLPTITNIKVNDNVVCEGKDEGGYVSRVSLQHTLHTKVITGYGPGDSDQEQEEHIHHNPQHSAYRPVPVPMPSRPRPRPGPTSSRPSSPPVRPSSPPVRPTSPPLHENLPIFSQFLNNMAFTGATTKRPAPTATTSRTTTTSAPTTTTTRITTTRAPVTSKPDPSSDLQNVCGQQAMSYQPLVIGGIPIEKGSWPWLVALYVNDPKSLSFNCGGNLISSRTILTAAHCLKVRKVEHKPEHLLVVAGRHNLLDWNESTSKTSAVERVIIHPDYDENLENFDGDLALIIVKKSIKFTSYIKPICLWNEESDLKNIEGESGIVVGWGKNEDGMGVSAEPKKVTAKIVSNEDCLRSNSQFSQLTSNRTLCAGDRDGQGPCTGDSGGGLVLQRNDRYFLRGLVSGAFNDPQTSSCNLQEYVIYSDVAKFMDWVSQEMVY